MRWQGRALGLAAVAAAAFLLAGCAGGSGCTTRVEEAGEPLKVAETRVMSEVSTATVQGTMRSTGMSGPGGASSAGEWSATEQRNTTRSEVVVPVYDGHQVTRRETVCWSGAAGTLRAEAAEDLRRASEDLREAGADLRQAGEDLGDAPPPPAPGTNSTS